MKPKAEKGRAARSISYFIISRLGSQNVGTSVGNKHVAARFSAFSFMKRCERIDFALII